MADVTIMSMQDNETRKNKEEVDAMFKKSKPMPLGRAKILCACISMEDDDGKCRQASTDLDEIKSARVPGRFQ